MQRALVFAAVALLATAAPGSAATLAFSGTFDTSNPPAAVGGRCPVLTVNIDNTPPFYATGRSNLGAFTATESHCLNSGPPVALGAPDVSYFDGLFTYNFASGDSLSGIYDGLLSNAGVAGAFNNVQHFLITNGTGKFTGAMGSFLGNGQIRFTGGPPVATLTISNGVITTAAVPEPATWLLLMTGFGVAGLVLRRRTWANHNGVAAAELCANYVQTRG